MYDEFGNPCYDDLYNQDMFGTMGTDYQNQYELAALNSRMQQIAYKEYNAAIHNRFARYTTQDVIAGLKNYIYSLDSSNRITKVEKLSDPNVELLRHACVMTAEKITYLQLTYFQVQYNFSLPFYYCRACGALYIPNEIVIPQIM